MPRTAHDPPTQVMRHFRAATAELHACVEDAVGLMAPELDRVRYAQTLRRFRSVYVPLERCVDEVGACDSATREVLQALDWPARRKAALLDDDLRGLDEEVVIDPAPTRALDVLRSNVRDLPSVVGALYVTEGATLGGAVIAPHLRTTIGAGVPQAFLTAYGDQVGARWSDFRRVARAALVAPEDAERGIDAARVVFGQFLEAFDA